MNVCNSILGNTYLYICHFMNCKSNTIGMLHITWLEEIHYLLLLWQKSLVRFRNFVKFWVNYNLIMTVPSIMNNVLYLFWALFEFLSLSLSFLSSILYFLTMFKADFTWTQEIDGCIDEEGCLKFVHVMLSSYFPHNIS